MQPRNITAQFTPAVLLLEGLQSGAFGRSERSDFGGGFECFEFAKSFNRRPLGGAPFCLRFDHQRGRDLVTDQVTEADDHDHRRDDLKRRVETRQGRTAKSILKKIRHRDEPHPPKPRVHEPVIGIHEQRLQREPDAGGSFLVNQARGTDCAVGVGGVAEVQEELVKASQLSPGQKEILLTLSRPRRPPTHVDYDRQISGDNEQIEDMEIAERHRGEKAKAEPRSEPRAPANKRGFASRETPSISPQQSAERSDSSFSAASLKMRKRTSSAPLAGPGA